MSVLKIINELAADNSRLAKEAILTREKSNTALISTLIATLNPYIQYHIKKIPEYRKDQPKSVTLIEGISLLTQLSERVHTGHAGISHLTKILEQCTEPEVIELIIDRDLRCGVNEATVNKIWPGLVPTFDVLLCSTDISRIEFPALIQEKLDGARVHLMWDGSEVKAFTRSGKNIPLFGALDESAKNLIQPGEVWDGELLIEEDGKFIDRKTGNGLINKLLKGKGDVELASKVRMVAWDIVDFTSTIPYLSRLANLEGRFEVCDKQKIYCINTEMIDSIEEAYEHFDRMVKDGKEGSIVKNKSFVWQGKRIKDCVKLKAELDATLEVIGVEEGTGKNVGRLGALVCQSKDGNVKVKVGTGFSDELREEFWVNTPTFIDVTYNAVVDDKRTNQKSLFLPRFTKDRSQDKTEADVI